MTLQEYVHCREKALSGTCSSVNAQGPLLSYPEVARYTTPLLHGIPLSIDMHSIARTAADPAAFLEGRQAWGDSCSSTNPESLAYQALKDRKDPEISSRLTCSISWFDFWRESRVSQY